MANYSFKRGSSKHEANWTKELPAHDSHHYSKMLSTHAHLSTCHMVLIRRDCGVNWIMSADNNDKIVLVQYLSSNKKIRIPRFKDVTDLEYIDREFRRVFNPGAVKGSSVSLVISFQRYDTDWQEYVDIEKDDEVSHKEKLRAVVLPHLQTPTESVSSDDIQVVMSYMLHLKF